MGILHMGPMSLSIMPHRPRGIHNGDVLVASSTRWICSWMSLDLPKSNRLIWHLRCLPPVYNLNHWIVLAEQTWVLIGAHLHRTHITLPASTSAPRRFGYVPSSRYASNWCASLKENLRTLDTDGSASPLDGCETLFPRLLQKFPSKTIHFHLIERSNLSVVFDTFISVTMTEAWMPFRNIGPVLSSNSGACKSYLMTAHSRDQDLYTSDAAAATYSEVRGEDDHQIISLGFNEQYLSSSITLDNGQSAMYIDLSDVKCSGGALRDCSCIDDPDFCETSSDSTADDVSVLETTSVTDLGESIFGETHLITWEPLESPLRIKHRNDTMCTSDGALRVSRADAVGFIRISSFGIPDGDLYSRILPRWGSENLWRAHRRKILGSTCGTPARRTLLVRSISCDF